MKIEVEFSEAGLFQGLELGEMNVTESADEFTSLLWVELTRKYPEAYVSIVYGIQDKHTVDGGEESDVAVEVGEIVHEVWEGEGWVTYAEES